MLGHPSRLPRSHRIDLDELLSRAAGADQGVRLSSAEISSLIREASRLRHHADLLEAQLATSRAMCNTLNDRIGEYQERHALLLEVLREWLRMTTGLESDGEPDAWQPASPSR